MRSLARQQGGECLSEEYVDQNTPLRWRCASEHEWESRPHDVKQGYWCRECYRLRHRQRCEIEKRKKFAEAKALARKNGGTCLSTVYEGNSVPLQWRCANGHVWSTKPINVTIGHWCPECGKDVAAARARSTRLGIELMRKLASKRGGRCLSTNYVNTQTKLHWECKVGHRWFAVPSNVKNGSWCPACAHKRLAQNLAGWNRSRRG